MSAGETPMTSYSRIPRQLSEELQRPDERSNQFNLTWDTISIGPKPDPAAIEGTASRTSVGNAGEWACSYGYMGYWPGDVY